MSVLFKGIELKSGMVIVDRDGDVGIIISDSTANSNCYAVYKSVGQILNNDEFLDNFIKKIYVSANERPHNVIRQSKEILNRNKENFNPKEFELRQIYTNEKVIEVTMKDIEEKFGGKVKITL